MFIAFLVGVGIAIVALRLIYINNVNFPYKPMSMKLALLILLACHFLFVSCLVLSALILVAVALLGLDNGGGGDSSELLEMFGFVFRFGWYVYFIIGIPLTIAGFNKEIKALYVSTKRKYATKKKNRLLRKIIKSKALTISRSRKLLKSYENKSISYRKYSAIRKKVNQILIRGKNTDFIVEFKEDASVKRVIHLLNLLSERNVLEKYEKYKKIFNGQQGIYTLKQLSSNSLPDNLKEMIKNTIFLFEEKSKEYMCDLKRVETAMLNFHSELYSKYNIV